MDVAYRGSAVAVGAATFNARVAASALGTLGPVDITEGDDGNAPLRAVVRLAAGRDDTLAALYQPMLERETNRHRGARRSWRRRSSPISRPLQSPRAARFGC